MTAIDLDKRWLEAGNSVDEVEHLEIIDQGFGRFLTWAFAVAPEFVKVNGVLMASFNLGQYLRTISAAMLWITPSATESNRFDACITEGLWPSPDSIEHSWSSLTLGEVAGLTHWDWRI